MCFWPHATPSCHLLNHPLGEARNPCMATPTKSLVGPTKWFGVWEIRREVGEMRRSASNWHLCSKMSPWTFFSQEIPNAICWGRGGGRISIPQSHDSPMSLNAPLPHLQQRIGGPWTVWFWVSGWEERWVNGWRVKGETLVGVWSVFCSLLDSSGVFLRSRGKVCYWFWDNALLQILAPRHTWY